ncbi:MAG: transforming growth factor-beta-induced protein, partial [Psychroserpens sp.]
MFNHLVISFHKYYYYIINVEQQKLKKMKIISKTIKFLPLFLMALVITSCSYDDDNGGTTTTPPQLNIVETAIATSELTSLVAALQAADGDLVTVLSGSGPFTVLAPTNAAFATFLSDNNFANLSDVPTDVLSQILLNHVISADLSSTDLTGLGAGYTRTNATGAGGNTMSIYFNTSNGVRFNNVSSVSTADVSASNGTVHIVDAVIGLPSIVDHAVNNSNFSELAGALTSEDLVTTLQGAGPFTVLAPVNDAFSDFTNPDSNALSNILLNHVLVGAITSTDLVSLGNIYTNSLATGPNDNAISLYSNTDNGVRFNGVSSVAIADVIGTNGIIHAVDAVIDIPSVVTFATAD